VKIPWREAKQLMDKNLELRKEVEELRSLLSVEKYLHALSRERIKYLDTEITTMAGRIATEESTSEESTSEDNDFKP
jgi:hypothetical protein